MAEAYPPPVYIILESRDSQTLCELVQTAMRQGYRPLGGVAIADMGSDIYMVQAMMFVL